MSRKKPRIEKSTIALVIVCVLIIALWIYAIITYGGKPLKDIPIWAIWVLFGK